MCGIALLWDPRTPSDERRRAAEHFIRLLRHRGPDDQGIWLAGDVPLALAHTRLAIRGLGVPGAHPMVAPGEAGVLIYNGELFDVAPLRTSLAESGVRLKGTSD